MYHMRGSDERCMQNINRYSKAGVCKLLICYVVAFIYNYNFGNMKLKPAVFTGRLRLYSVR